MGFIFRVGEIFANKAMSRKTQKIPPRENFPCLQKICFGGVGNMSLLEDIWIELC